MKEIREYFDFSFSKDDIHFYEAKDGELIAYKGGHINKLNVFAVDNDLNLVRSLYLDRSIAYVCGTPSKICVVKEE